MPHLPTATRSPLHPAVRHAQLTVLASAAFASEQARHYAIAAGNLDRALNRFASEAGILLSTDAQLTAGKRSPGLDGSHSVPEGLAQGLAGSGPRALDSGGDYALEKVVDSANALELGATTIQSGGLGAITEDTDSCTTAQTSTASKMNLSIRETPQTITVVRRQRMDDQHLANMTDVLGLHT